ncbi:MAG: invasion protein [Hyphomicrobiaceae bacterium]|nr:MAG: invasion protein [Hyphomicrobiaceae bacterium]
MANSVSHLAMAGRIRRTGAVAAALVLGCAALTGGAFAQAKKDKAPPPAAAKKDAKDAKAAPGTQSAWVKLCEKATAVTKDKDGKEQKKDMNICLTHHERLDGNSGMVLVSAAVRQVDAQDKQHFMVMVPLGMMLQPGMRATIYPKDAWEKVQKNEKVDESKLKGMKLSYTLCHPAGCTAEMESTPELINDLKSSGGVMVFAINAAGAPVAFPVPLNGFDQAYAGGPIDSKKYGEARRALMQQIAQRQQQLIEEYKKKQEEQKGAAPAAKAPAPAKK